MSLCSSEIYVYIAILLLAMCSVITRAGYLLFGDHIPLPQEVHRALHYAPASALTAIIIPVLLPWEIEQGPLFDPKLVAGVVSVLMFLFTRSAMLLITSGMLALWLLKAFIH